MRDTLLVEAVTRTPLHASICLSFRINGGICIDNNDFPCSMYDIEKINLRACKSIRGTVS